MKKLRKLALLGSALALTAGLAAAPAVAQAHGGDWHPEHPWKDDHGKKRHHWKHHGWVPPGHRYYHYYEYGPPRVIYRPYYKEYHHYYPRHYDRRGSDVTIIWRGRF
ncbi:hypothetical protein [Pelomicrobium sp.]|jgi:hypothetical protein|uniref:hypothetical protein n=1 Tax=Pelomicrobium sp. TaxID=2815319 RepID=UPI002FDD1435